MGYWTEGHRSDRKDRQGHREPGPSIGVAGNVRNSRLVGMDWLLLSLDLMPKSAPGRTGPEDACQKVPQPASTTRAPVPLPGLLDRKGSRLVPA